MPLAPKAPFRAFAVLNVRASVVPGQFHLGVAPNASAEEVVAAYRKLAQKHYPDKVADLGPEFRELAERRMKEINAAYAQLKPKT